MNRSIIEKGGNKMYSILIVEDEPIIRRGIAFYDF